KSDLPIRELPAACADEAVAVEFMEKHRWGEHPGCPHCGDMDVYKMTGKDGGREKHFRWRCRGCKKQFSVRTGTVFEDSRIPLRHWCFAFWRASTSKKGVSALEIHRQTGISYKSCLFMLNRIRFAMSDSAPGVLGPESGIVEVDETYVGGRPRHPNFHNPDGKVKYTRKQPVLAMVERGGKVKTKPIANVTGANVQAIMRENIDSSARIATDQSSAYPGCDEHFSGGHRS